VRESGREREGEREAHLDGMIDIGVGLVASVVHSALIVVPGAGIYADRDGADVCDSGKERLIDVFGELNYCWLCRMIRLHISFDYGFDLNYQSS